MLSLKSVLWICVCSWGDDRQETHLGVIMTSHQHHCPLFVLPARCQISMCPLCFYVCTRWNATSIFDTFVFFLRMTDLQHIWANKLFYLRVCCICPSLWYLLICHWRRFYFLMGVKCFCLVSSHLAPDIYQSVLPAAFSRIIEAMVM